jgi:hypothetical protein
MRATLPARIHGASEPATSVAAACNDNCMPAPEAAQPPPRLRRTARPHPGKTACVALVGISATGTLAHVVGDAVDDIAVGAMLALLATAMLLPHLLPRQRSLTVRRGPDA